MTVRVMRCSSLAIPCLVVSVLFTASGFAQSYCSNASAIDLVPYFIGQTYQDILNRGPDSAGQASYNMSTKYLNTTQCSEANGSIAANPCAWINNAQVILDFLASPESISKNGTLADNTAFITALYQLLLRRAADTKSVNYYLSLLNSGVTRLSVVSTFLRSDEYRQRFACTSAGSLNPSCNGAETIDPVSLFVSQLYLDALDRPATSAEQTKWTNYITSDQAAMCMNVSDSAFSTCDRLMEAQTVLSVFSTNGLAGDLPPVKVNLERATPLAHGAFPALSKITAVVSNAAFVTNLYRYLLRSTPDPKGLDFYTQYLNTTGDKLGTIYAFLTSDQYRQRFACYAGAADRLNFGINGHPLSQPAYSNTTGVSLATQMELVKKASFGIYRVDMFFSDTGFDFTSIDPLVQAAKEQSIQLLPVLCAVSPMNSETTTGLYNKAFSAAFAIVSRYKDSIHVWELDNERDIYSSYRYGDPWNGGTFPYQSAIGTSVEDYYPPRLATSEAIIHGLADGARAADPSSLRIVNFAWVHTGFLQNLENDGIPYDIVGIHWYGNVDVQSQGGMGDMTCPGQNLPCTPPLQYHNLISTLQTITNGKPLWVTEANYWPLNGNSVSFDLSSETKYLPPALKLYRDSPSTYPLQVLLVYELLDEPDAFGQGPFFSEMGVYETTQANNYTYLGPAKPVYEPMEQIVTPPEGPQSHTVAPPVFIPHPARASDHQPETKFILLDPMIVGPSPFTGLSGDTGQREPDVCESPGSDC